MRATDLVGRVFGELTVTSLTVSSGTKRKWLCRCSCGKRTSVVGSNLTTGNTRSCGHVRSEVTKARSIRHGMTRTAEYRAWLQLIQRCTVPQNPKYPSYGGRGIRVCDRWRNSFEAFLSDMGKRPSPDLSIDRINNDGNYEPGNCRWATRSQQARNTRRQKRAA